MLYQLAAAPCLVALMLLSATEADGSLLPDDVQITIDNRAQSFVDCKEMVGLGIVVVNKTSTLLARGYGTLKAGGSDMVTADTMYPIAGVGVTMFSITLGIVLQNSQYTFDTKVHDIVGDDVKFHCDMLTSFVTLRDLLSHRTGLNGYMMAVMQPNLTTERVLEILPHMESFGQFRSSYMYSNFMYIVASHVMEKITGDPWRTTMKTVLFEPLGMTSTTFLSETAEVEPNMALPGLNDRMTGDLNSLSPTYRKMVKAGAAGDVVSTPNDMAKYLRCVLNRGKGDDGTQVVPFTVLDEVYTVANSAPPISQSMLVEMPIPKYFSLGYGLGTNNGLYNGERSMTHRGSIFGLESRLRMIQQRGVAVYVMTSSERPPNAEVLPQLVLDMLTGALPPSPNTSVTCRPWQAHPVPSVDPGRPLSDYQGRYENPIYGNIDVFVEDDVLKMKYGVVIVWRFLAKGPDTFDIEADNVINSFGFYHRNVQFTFDNNNFAISVKIPTFDRVTEPVFTREDNSGKNSDEDEDGNSDGNSDEDEDGNSDGNSDEDEQ